MKTTGRYVFDNTSILEKSYELICLFFASKEISRRADPNLPDTPLTSLEKRFFESKVSRLLIEIATLLRVMGEQINKLTDEDPVRIHYINILCEVDKYEFGLFDDSKLTLRETCNKIIHSEIFEIQTKEGLEGHETDLAFLHGMQSRSVKWRHVSNYVRLAGRKGNQQWYVLLDIEIFVSAIVRLIT